MLEPLQTLAQAARRRLRLQALLAGLRRGWVPAGVTALALIVMWELGLGGFSADRWPFLLVPLALPVAFALWAVRRPIPLARAALALDGGAGLDDRIGTALALREMRGGLIERQRQDALDKAQGVAVRRALPVVWWRAFAPLLPLLPLIALVGWLAATFDPPQVRAPQVPSGMTDLEAAADDLLEQLADWRAHLADEGADKLSLAMIDDLAQRVQRVQDEETRRRMERERNQPEEEPELLPTPTPTPEVAPPEQSPGISQDLLSAAQMASLEATLNAELSAATAQNQARLQQAMERALIEHPQMRDVLGRLSAESAFRNYDSLSDTFDQRGRSFGPNREGFNNMPAEAGQQTDWGQEGAEIQQNALAGAMNQQDAENLGDTERAHAMAGSFREFLSEYTKALNEQIARSALGLGREDVPEDRVVNTSGGQGQQGQGGQPGQSSGDGSAESELPLDPEAGFEEAEANPNRASRPSDGPPPEGAEMGEISIEEGEASGSAASLSGSAGGDTSRGAEGAGAGSGPGGDLAQSRPVAGSSGERLERVLARMTEGRMPEGQRESLFDGVARHSAQVDGPGDNFESPFFRDYFSRADDLIDEAEDTLAPGTRSFIRSYFDALREGDDSPAPE